MDGPLRAAERDAQHPHSICGAPRLADRPAQTQGLHLHPRDVKPCEKPQTQLTSPHAYGPQKQKPARRMAGPQGQCRTQNPFSTSVLKATGPLHRPRGGSGGTVTREGGAPRRCPMCLPACPQGSSPSCKMQAPVTFFPGLWAHPGAGVCTSVCLQPALMDSNGLRRHRAGAAGCQMAWTRPVPPRTPPWPGVEPENQEPAPGLEVQTAKRHRVKGLPARDGDAKEGKGGDPRPLPSLCSRVPHFPLVGGPHPTPESTARTATH